MLVPNKLACADQSSNTHSCACFIKNKKQSKRPCNFSVICSSTAIQSNRTSFRDQLRIGRLGYIHKPPLRWCPPSEERIYIINYKRKGTRPVDLKQRMVTAFLKNCNTIPGIVTILQQNKELLNPVNISAAVCRAAHLYNKLPASQWSPEVQDTVQAIMDLAASEFMERPYTFGRRNMVTVLWAMVKVEYDNEQFNFQWLKCATSSIELFTGRQIALTIWCLSSRGWSQGQDEYLFTDAAIRRVQTALDLYNDLDISMLLCALAKNDAQIGDPLVQRLFNKAAEREIELADKQSAQSLVNTLWAFARLRIYVPEMVQRINQEFKLRPGELEPQHVANLLWSFMRLKFFDKKTFQLLALQVSTQMDHFSPQAISSSMYAFCWYVEHFTIEHEQLYRKGKELFRQRIEEFEPLHITNMLYAYSSISTVRGEELFDIAVDLMELAIDRVIRDFDSFDLHCVSVITLSYGRMGLADDQLFELIFQRVKHYCNDFRISSLVKLLYGAVMSGRDDRELLKIVLKRINALGSSQFQQQYFQLLQKALNNVRIADEELEQLVFVCKVQVGVQKRRGVAKNRSAFQEWLSKGVSLKYYDTIGSYDGNIDSLRSEDSAQDGADY